MEIPRFRPDSLPQSYNGQSKKEKAWNEAWQRLAKYTIDYVGNHVAKRSSRASRDEGFRGILEGLEPYAKIIGGDFYKKKFQMLQSDFINGHNSSLEWDTIDFFSKTPPMLTDDQMREATFSLLETMKAMVERKAPKSEMAAFNNILGYILRHISSGILVPLTNYQNYFRTDFVRAIGNYKKEQSQENADQLIGAIIQLQKRLV